MILFALIVVYQDILHYLNNLSIKFFFNLDKQPFCIFWIRNLRRFLFRR